MTLSGENHLRRLEPPANCILDIPSSGLAQGLKQAQILRRRWCQDVKPTQILRRRWRQETKLAQILRRRRCQDTKLAQKFCHTQAFREASFREASCSPSGPAQPEAESPNRWNRAAPRWWSSLKATWPQRITNEAPLATTPTTPRPPPRHALWG